MFATKGKAASLPGQQVHVSGWLGLAAAPTFALMSWISTVGAPSMTMCSAVLDFAPINDMALMYLLMSLFHLSPWLKLLSHRFAAPHHSITQTEGD